MNRFTLRPDLPLHAPRIVLAVIATAVLVALPTRVMAQATITQWTFEGDVATPSTGAGTASPIGGTTASFAAGNGGGRAWNTTTYAAQSTGNGQRGVQFLFSTVGFQDISLAFDQRASGTASRWAQLDYTLNGGTDWTTGFWNNNGGLSPHDTFYTFNVNLSSITAANNNSGFGVRIVSVFSPQAFDQNNSLAPFNGNTAYMRANTGAVYSPNTSTATGDYGTTGTWRFDNVTLSGIAQGARNLTWSVAGGGTWDTTTANWTTGSDSTTFANGDSVGFGNSAGGTISLSGALQPALTTIDATAGTYTFSGVSGGTISGSTSIAKSNAGTAVFTTANDFTGGTTISGGTVRIDGGDRLGSGQIAFASGTLESVAAAATTLANNVAVGAAGGMIDTGVQNLTVTGATTLNGVLTKTGAATLTLGGAITSNAGTGYAVSAGTLQLGANATSNGVYRVSAATTLTGNLVISGTQRFDVNGNATISGAGTLRLPTSGALIATSSGDTGGTISSEIVLNSSGASFTPGSWSGTTYTPGTFLATIGATSGATTSSLNSLTVGVISGASDLDFSNNSSTGGGGGQLVLNAASTYTGNTTINFNAPNATGSSSIKLGVDNALPTTTGVVVGTKTGIRAPILDMNGRSQQVSYLADGANVSATQFLTITNLGTADSVLTIGGSVTPGTGFGGLITGGATAGSRISVVKTGANSQTLSGANTYTGGTTVSAGTLVAGNVSGFGTGGVIVNGGTLDLASLAIANAITANGGTITGASAYAGTQTVLGTVSFAGTVAGSVNVGSGGILKGNGTTFGGTVAIGASGVHAPGASPGAQTFNGPLSYAATSKLEWELWDNTNASADAGTDYDAITVTSTGSLAITSGAAVDLLFGTTAGGSTVSWTNAFWDSDRSWTIISASAASSSTGVFTLGSVGSDAAGVAFAAARPNAAFSVGRSGSGDIVLSYVAAVPEPSTWALAAVAAACVAGRVLRRRTAR